MQSFLLIDDSRVMRSVLKNMLAKAGFENATFHEATNGKEALQRLEELNYAVDVVFCDLHMPEMDGLEFIEKLNGTGKIESCPVVVLTGDIREARGEAALAKGARRLISKPFTAEAIGAVIDAVSAETNRTLTAG